MLSPLEFGYIKTLLEGLKESFKSANADGRFNYGYAINRINTELLLRELEVDKYVQKESEYYGEKTS